MLLSWLVSLAAHVVFRRRISADGLAALPMRSPFGAWGSAIGFVMVIAAILESGVNSHLTLISGAVYMVLLTVAYWLIRARRRSREVADAACQG
jgi:L-asparagine transporter-like permease